MSKLSKFRKSPALFFAESRHPWLREAGRVVAARVSASPTVMALLEDPLDALAEGKRPWARRLARRELARRARRRRERLAGAGWPTVSVVMAARNAASTIDGALASLLRQSYASLEIVVVDDASDDETLDLVREIARRDPRVRAIESERAGGAARARNFGLAAATGVYVTFQDADDASHPERIERQLAALLARDAMVSVCNVVRETADGERVVVNGRRFTKAVISMLFPREPVLSTIGYLRELTVGEDSEYYERLRTVFGKDREVHLFETLYRARFSPGSLLFSSGTVAQANGREVTFVHTEENQRRLDEALAELKAIGRGERSPYVAPST